MRIPTFSAVVALLVLAIASPLVPAAQRVAPAPDQWAVVIGAGHDRRQYADADADAVYQTLIGPMGFKTQNIVLLTSKAERAPTLTNIKWALGTFLGRAARKDDTVIIYFACHGGVEPDPRGVERDGNSKYLFAANTDPRDLYSTAIPMDELHTILSRYDAERVVMFVDASHSGAALGQTFAAGKRRAGDPLQELRSFRGRAVLTSSRPNEISLEAPDLGHGIFTYYLVEGLKGAADLNGDGIVTLHELYGYVEQRVTEKSRSLGGSQHPVLRGQLEGSLPLTKIRP